MPDTSPWSLPVRGGAAVTAQTSWEGPRCSPVPLAGTDGLCCDVGGLGRSKSCVGGRCGGRELGSSWGRVRGCGRGSGWSQVCCRPGCSAGLPGQGRVPAKDPSGTRGGGCPCCPSPGMSWHCEELAPPCPQGWVFSGGLYPSAASRCFPAGSRGFCGAEGILAEPGAGVAPAALCRGSSASSGTRQRRQQLGMAFFCWGLSLISDFLGGALPLVTGFPPFFLSSNIVFPSLPLALLPSAPRFPFSSIKL